MSKRLTLDETLELLKRWRENYDVEALHMLVMLNSGLVGHFSKKHIGQGLSFDELKSAGFEGLINAINKFDYKNKDMKAFSTYLSVSIYHAMEVDIQKYEKHCHVLSLNEVIGHWKDGDEKYIEDTVGTEKTLYEDIAISNIKNEALREVLKTLSDKEQKILLLRFGFDAVNTKTQQEVAEIMGCTQQSIDRQEKKALRKLRKPVNSKKIRDFVEK